MHSAWLAAFVPIWWAGSDTQFWTELDVAAQLTRSVSVTLLATNRLSLDLPNPQLGAGGVVVDLRANRAITLSVGYLCANLPHTGQGYAAQLPLAAISAGRRFGRWSIQERSRGERLFGIPGAPYRFRQKVDAGYQLTPRLRVIASDEAFYQTGVDRWSQNRLQAGVRQTLTRAVSLDLVYLQRSTLSQPKTTRALGITAHVALGRFPRHQQPQLSERTRNASTEIQD